MTSFPAHKTADCFNFPSPTFELPKKDHMRFRQFFAFNKENFKNRFFIEELLDKLSPPTGAAKAAFSMARGYGASPFSTQNPARASVSSPRVS